MSPVWRPNPLFFLGLFFHSPLFIFFYILQPFLDSMFTLCLYESSQVTYCIEATESVVAGFFFVFEGEGCTWSTRIGTSMLYLWYIDIISDIPHFSFWFFVNLKALTKSSDFVNVLTTGLASGFLDKQKDAALPKGKTASFPQIRTSV